MEQELVTFKDVMEKKYVLLIFPDGVIGVYRPSSDSFSESIRNVMRETFSEGKVLALVPVSLDETHFFQLNGGLAEGEVIQ